MCHCPSIASAIDKLTPRSDAACRPPVDFELIFSHFAAPHMDGERARVERTRGSGLHLKDIAEDGRQGGRPEGNAW